MEKITLFNAFKKVTWKLKALDMGYARFYAHEDEKIANWRKTRKRYERLEHKLDFRLSYFLEWGKMPRPTHCVICGWWEASCGCAEFRAPAGHDEDGDSETQHWRDHTCPNGYGGECGYYDYSHGPKDECPASGDEAERFRQLRIKERNRSTV